MELTVTAKIQIQADDNRDILLQTMKRYTEACNFVSDYVFKTHDLVQSSLNKHLYYDLRKSFGLRSQMTQSVMRNVIACYKTILENQHEWIKPDFKRLQYELVWNRDYSLVNDTFSVNTLNGRVKCSYYKAYVQKYFDKSIYRFGSAKLVYRHKKFYLHVPVSFDTDDCNLSDVRNVAGVDLGINFIAVSYNSSHVTRFYDGHVIKHKRAYYKNLRKQLQQVRTPSSRRRLKAIGSRENRWIQDVNHCISKALVESNPERSLFVLEDLTGVRRSTEKVCLKNRYVSVSWSYYDLAEKITYKALCKGSMVIKVDPRYTSQTCPCCGHTEPSNRDKRNHLFTCKACGYKSNDDRIGAMNLYRKGIEHVSASVPDTVALEQIS